MHFQEAMQSQEKSTIPRHKTNWANVLKILESYAEGLCQSKNDTLSDSKFILIGSIYCHAFQEEWFRF